MLRLIRDWRANFKYYAQLQINNIVGTEDWRSYMENYTSSLGGSLRCFSNGRDLLDYLQWLISYHFSCYSVYSFFACVVTSSISGILRIRHWTVVNLKRIFSCKYIFNSLYTSGIFKYRVVLVAFLLLNVIPLYMLASTYYIFTPELSWKCVKEQHSGISKICQLYPVSSASYHLKLLYHTNCCTG